jgi:hypothetical protein
MVAISYTCPTGTAAQSTRPTLEVSDSAVPIGGPGMVAAARGDDADLLGGGAGGVGLGAGSYWLDVTTAPTCLWHLAVYRG